MSRSRRRAAARPTIAALGHAAPGSYARQADGALQRTDTPTREPEAANPGGPAMSQASARATADALAAVGAEIPPSVQAVLDAASAAPAATDNDDPAGSGQVETQTPEADDGATQTQPLE